MTLLVYGPGVHIRHTIRRGDATIFIYRANRQCWGKRATSPAARANESDPRARVIGSSSHMRRGIVRDVQYTAYVVAVSDNGRERLYH